METSQEELYSPSKTNSQKEPSTKKLMSSDIGKNERVVHINNPAKLNPAHAVSSINSSSSGPSRGGGNTSRNHSNDGSPQTSGHSQLRSDSSVNTNSTNSIKQLKETLMAGDASHETRNTNEGFEMKALKINP
jgi:hypothetical protein